MTVWIIMLLVSGAAAYGYHHYTAIHRSMTAYLMVAYMLDYLLVHGELTDEGVATATRMQISNASCLQRYGVDLAANLRQNRAKFTQILGPRELKP